MRHCSDRGPGAHSDMIRSGASWVTAWALVPLVGMGAGCTESRGDNPGPPEIPSTYPAPNALRVETLVSGLHTPWDLAWGPDGALWVTERPGRISRVDVASGDLEVLAELPVTESGESGLMGMAFHPRFETEPYVFVVHSYGDESRIRNRLVRLRFDGSRLVEPETLIDEIPGRGNHDGARLAIGPDGFLYMTMGDASNQEDAQNPASLSGKILRLTLDGRPAPGNPFGSAAFSIGHRNPQGLVFQSGTARLYSAEHGPDVSDEVNLIRAGGNYGWPDVRGSCDDESVAETRFCRDNDTTEPLAEWTPTVGLSGLDAYDSDLIPGWRGSLLVTSLRGETLWRLMLSEEGGRVTGREMLFAGIYGRLRDVLVGPGGEFYLATSNQDGRGSPGPTDDRILRVQP